MTFDHSNRFFLLTRTDRTIFARTLSIAFKQFLHGPINCWLINDTDQTIAFQTILIDSFFFFDRRYLGHLTRGCSWAGAGEECSAMHAQYFIRKYHGMIGISKYQQQCSLSCHPPLQLRPSMISIFHSEMLFSIIKSIADYWKEWHSHKVKLICFGIIIFFYYKRLATRGRALVH